MEETGGPKSDDGWSDIAVGYYLDPEHVWNGASGLTSTKVGGKEMDK